MTELGWKAVEVGRVALGREYDYAGPRWNAAADRLIKGPPSRYAVRAFCRHALTHQELVVYEGVGGADAGQWWCCPLIDFARKFTPVAPPEVPGKVAGVIPEGTHV